LEFKIKNLIAYNKCDSWKAIVFVNCKFPKLSPRELNSVGRDIA